MTSDMKTSGDEANASKKMRSYASADREVRGYFLIFDGFNVQFRSFIRLVHLFPSHFDKNRVAYLTQHPHKINTTSVKKKKFIII